MPSARSLFSLMWLASFLFNSLIWLLFSDLRCLARSKDFFFCAPPPCILFANGDALSGPFFLPSFFRLRFLRFGFVLLTGSGGGTLLFPVSSSAALSLLFRSLDFDEGPSSGSLSGLKESEMNILKGFFKATIHLLFVEKALQDLLLQVDVLTLFLIHLSLILFYVRGTYLHGLLQACPLVQFFALGQENLFGLRIEKIANLTR